MVSAATSKIAGEMNIFYNDNNQQLNLFQSEYVQFETIMKITTEMNTFHNDNNHQLSLLQSEYCSL